MVFIILFCGGLAYAMGWAARRLRWYNAAYGDAMALEYMDQASPWKITHIGLTKLVRLAFIAEEQDYYFGSTEESGIDRGMMLLKADAHTGGLRGMAMRRLFDLPAGGGGFTGTSSRALQALVDNSEDLAETKPNPPERTEAGGRDGLLRTADRDGHSDLHAVRERLPG